MTNIRSLRELNLDDLVRAVGWGPLSQQLPALRRLLDPPALSFARVLAEFDHRIGKDGLRAAACWTLARLNCRVRSTPAPQGAALMVSNHPGLGDALALFSLMGEPDLRVLALDRPVLRLMPNLASHLILLTPGREGLSALRKAQQHLEGGGRLLTFPAGRIEPDPAWTEAVNFDRWSASPWALARRVPGRGLQPVLVSGVRRRRYVDPWLMRWHRRPEDRDWGGAILQLSAMLRASGPTTVIDVQWGTELAITGDRSAEHQSLVVELSRLSKLSRR